MFLDHIHLLVQAGNGGKGCESYFHRIDKKIIRHGGDGGNGGSVIFRAEVQAPPISDFRFRQHILAESGGHGGSNKKRGRNGKDLVVPVPVGVRIYDRGNQFLVRELKTPGEEVIAAKGGKGGSGNYGGKQPTPGEPGEVLDIELSIRLQADIFLVGLPNSGKSALLNSLTRTRIKQEDYPFSTRTPEMGVYKISDYESLRICELPSVYASSHEGHGLGSDFLKHLETAKRIFYVLDPVSEFADSLSDGFSILRKQIRLHEKKFLKIPHAIIVSKMDLAEAKARVKKQRFKPGAPVFYLSLVSREGFEKLTEFLNGAAEDTSAEIASPETPEESER